MPVSAAPGHTPQTSTAATATEPFLPFSAPFVAYLFHASLTRELGIGGLLNRRPATLSGGEKQRVALARALLSSPQILLMDEPLSGVDDARRNEIMGLIEHVRDEFRVPIVYVTHSRNEVQRLASRVVRLEAGRVASVGSAADLPGDDASKRKSDFAST